MPKQLSDAWFAAKEGVLSASMFSCVLAKPSTKKYQSYMQDVIDQLLGVPDFEDRDKPWFSHGKQWESQARGQYEWETGYEVEQDFFIVHPKYKFIGASPDGFIPPDGNLEIKSHKSLKEYLKSMDKLESKHRPQVYGQLWVTGRKWADMANFYKNEVNGQTLLNIFRVEPDLEYFKKLESACVSFWQEIQKRLGK